MMTIEQILESIENKKNELREQDKRRYGDDLSKVAQKGTPIIGYNIPWDPVWLTSHLADEEFKEWYTHKQMKYWEQIKEAGVEEVECFNCKENIEEPQQVMRWAGIPYHGDCFIDSAETGKPTMLLEDSRLYYKRIKKAVFGRS